MPYRRPVRRDQIAVQLFSVRREMAADLPGTLRAVRAAGYDAVELAGLPDLPAAEIADRLGEAGLRAIAAHERIEGLRRDPHAVAARLRALGCPRVLVPAMPEADRRTVADVRRFAAELGSLARVLGDHGLRLGHHNHDYEFAPLGGTTAWQILLDELPPEVELELDVYWAAVAGRDPVTEIRAAADRLRMLHVKDVAPGPEPREVPAGEGTLDIAAIVEAGRAAAVEWYVTEQVESDDPLRDIATAARYLASMAH
jgi:sugar phosphate isomerase/epimerase